MPPDRVPAPPNKRKVLTLRVDPATAKKLHAFALKRAKKLGRAASYNDCLIHLIHQAR